MLKLKNLTLTIYEQNLLQVKRNVCHCFTILFTTNASAQKISLKDLTVEHLVNPFSIDNPKPRFSWKIVSVIKNTKQSNYEIRLGTTAKIDKVLWKTRVNNDQSVLIAYDGPQLSSKTKYYWQVRVKDNHGNASAWSPVQFFQTGLKPEDWSAKWISVSGKDTSLASPLFRKEFNLKKK